MELEYEILDLLSRRNKALEAIEISNELGKKTDSEYLEVVEVLTKLSDNYDIYCSNKGRYMLFDRSPLKKGKININRKGFGFVDLIDEEDIFISSDNLNGAIHGDTVIAEVTGRKERNKLEGRILKIIDRKLDKVVGEFIGSKDEFSVIPDEEKLKIKIVIPKENVADAIALMKEFDIAAYEIGEIVKGDEGIIIE